MSKSRRNLIVEAFQARLAAILSADGFETNAGASVFLGETPQLGEGDPRQAVAIVIGDEQPNSSAPQVILQRLPVQIQALADANLEQPWLAAEAILSDIKRAIELEDRTLGGLVPNYIERGATQTLPREITTTCVGISITYFAPYREAWGNP